MMEEIEIDGVKHQYMPLPAPFPIDDITLYNMDVGSSVGTLVTAYDEEELIYEDEKGVTRPIHHFILNGTMTDKMLEDIKYVLYTSCECGLAQYILITSEPVEFKDKYDYAVKLWKEHCGNFFEPLCNCDVDQVDDGCNDFDKCGFREELFKELFIDMYKYGKYYFYSMATSC